MRVVEARVTRHENPGIFTTAGRETQSSGGTSMYNIDRNFWRRFTMPMSLEEVPDRMSCRIFTDG